MAPPKPGNWGQNLLGILLIGILILSAGGGRVSADPNPEPQQDRGVIYLTFDDGPHPMYTQMILNLLEQHGARGTFFPLGRRLQERWEIHQVQDLLNRGHALGNHSWDHPRLPGMDRVEMREELNRASVVLEKRSGYRPRCFRAPYGEVDAAVREVGTSLGMEHVSWDADPQEWRSPTVAEALAHIWARRHDGLVVLMHDRKWMTLPILGELFRAFPPDRWRFEALPQCGPGGDPLARMVTQTDDSPPVGSIWEAVQEKHGIRVTGWAYHPTFPAGGLKVTVNANGEGFEAVGVTSLDHSFSVVVETLGDIRPVCAWIGEPDRAGVTAFLGCIQPGGSHGSELGDL